MEDRQVAHSAKHAIDDLTTWRVIVGLHAFAAITLAMWLSTVVFWPWLASGVFGQDFAHRIESLLGTVFCHRISSRSMAWPQGQLLVCSRCTGVIAGYLLGAVLALCGAEKTPLWRIPWALLIIGLMGLSWLGGYLGYLQPAWHLERVIAGACGGLGGYIFIARCSVLLINWMHRHIAQDLYGAPG